MKITAGTLITARHEVRLLHGRTSLGCFPDLNELRHAVTQRFPTTAGCDWNDFGRGCQGHQSGRSYHCGALRGSEALVQREGMGQRHEL